MVTESPATPAAAAATSPTSGTSSRVMLHAPAAPAPPTAASVTPVGCKSAEPHKAKGWGRLRGSVAKAESWGGVSKAESMETLPGRTKRPGEAPLKKTDSCDSGITKSDLRLDGGGGEEEEEEEEEEKAAAPSAGASFLELKQELRGDIRALDRRMAALEAQLAQMLRLLKARESSGGSLGGASQAPSPGSDKDGFS
ncbi:Potassium voltage-gated channel subfamily H member 1 [Liparis tanakae]|uniref:Potassium voltage-gated channel subfamily H member 1 n=1 Tax=Liparis tanakae TaxID=230148 RepID=A0A4Z2FRU6_9TELE|nr:Potassium voltage-gated channel subfamily H member 1 [Liparis tanakae]